jgi:hypothetical protein
MLPVEWKKEIQKCIDDAQRTSDESRKSEQTEQTTAIAAPLESLRKHFKAYVEKQDRYEKGKRRREMTTITGLFVTAFLTLCLACTGIAQVYSFIVSERAFVVPVQTNFTNGLVVRENPLEMWMALKNKGKSIASIDGLEVAITHKLPVIPQYYGAQKVAYPPIAPGDTFERPLEFVTGWSQETINQLTGGAIDLFIYGRVKYRDDFSWFGPRTNGFCFKYRRGPISGPHVFEICHETAYTYSN